MENSSVSENSSPNNNIFDSTFNIGKFTYGKSEIDSYNLTEEVRQNLFRYLKNFNLDNDPDLLILPPNNHYYFDEKELKNVRTIINLKNLNLIKDLDSLLRTLIRITPPNINFIGYFSYNKLSLNVDEFLSGLSTRFYNLLDSKTDHNMDKKEISGLLKKYGFKIVDMTEMNGLTYFYSQNTHHQSVRIRA
jgi:hypothetical protein